MPLPGPKATVLLGIMVELHVPQDQQPWWQIYFTLRLKGVVLLSTQHTKHLKTLTGKGLSSQGVLAYRVHTPSPREYRAGDIFRIRFQGP